MAGEPVVIFNLDGYEALKVMESVWQAEEIVGVDKTAFSSSVSGHDAEVSADSKTGENRFRRALKKLRIPFSEGTEEHMDNFIGAAFGFNRDRVYPK